MNVKNPDRLIKADRLNYIVNRMRVQKDITPAHLSEELKVSERTIYRDLRNLEKKQTLKKRYSRREGRYVFETELTLPPLTFTPSEALAVFAAAANPALGTDSFFSRDLQSGLSKVSNALTVGNSNEEGGESITSPSSLLQPTMEMVRRSMRSNRKLRIRYWSSATESERLLAISPYDMRERDGIWYLLARSEEQNQIRLFKLSRVRAVEILQDRFRFPRRFQPDAAFELAYDNYTGQDEEITVTIKFSAAVAPQIAEIKGRNIVGIETRQDGTALVKVVVSSLREIYWWILSYGMDAEAVSPPELRYQFAQLAKSLLARYVDSLG